MNPAPGTSWPDLHYVDAEQVELDVCAIIARGTRLRRRHLIGKVAAAAVIVGIAPVAVVMAVNGYDLPGHTTTASGEKGQPLAPRARGPATWPAGGGTFSTEKNSSVHAGVNAPAQPLDGYQSARAATTGRDLMFSLGRAKVLRTTTLPPGYQPLLAAAGAPDGSGLWFAATAGQLTLFRLSMAGALRSWSLPTPASSVRASHGVGLAVTSTGVAWIGVGSSLLRLDTKSSYLSAWHLPGLAAGSSADSVAVSRDGHVAVVTSYSRIVRVLDPSDGQFRQIRLPDAADRPLAVGYARNGTLGIGYRHLGKLHSGGVFLVERTGAKRTVAVPQPTAVTALGGSGLLVGATMPYVVPARGHPRPLILPAGSPEPASLTTAPTPLPGDRLAIAMDNAILTFPAAATSDAIAAGQSTVWVTPPPRCRPGRHCPAGYRLLADDAGGDLWVVPNAEPRTVELISLG